MEEFRMKDNENHIKHIVSKIGHDFKHIEHAKPEEIAALIKDIKLNPHIMLHLKPESRQRIDVSLAWYENGPLTSSAKEHMDVTKPHLKKVWPQIVNVYTSGGVPLDLGTGHNLTDSILQCKKKISNLSGEQLIEFAKRVERSNKLSSLKAYQGTRKIVHDILEEYTTLAFLKGAKAAREYADKKKITLAHIFKNIYLKHLPGAVARGEIKAKNK